MKCPKCNSSLPDGATYCDQCGTALKGSTITRKPLKFSFGPRTVATRNNPVTYPVVTSEITPSPDLSQSETWCNRISLNRRNSEESWIQKLKRKCIIATIITLAIAVLILVIKIWPGCLISASLLLFAIATTVLSFVVQLPDVSKEAENEKDERTIANLFNHMINMILIWEAFWLAAGLVCLAFSWWAVLIAEIINIVGLFIFAVGVLEELSY